jgi:hypothetical protein
VAYSVQCTVVEIPAMSEALRRRGLPGFVDLVPWADPYIAGLVEKLQMEGGTLLAQRNAASTRKSVRAEAPPPSFEEFSNPHRDYHWPRRN